MGGAVLWARREIRRGWPSLVIVALLLAIAGGAVMAGLAGARRAASSVDRFLADSSLAGLTAFTQAIRLDDQLRADLEADPRIEALAESRIVMVAPAGTTPGIDGVTIVVPDGYLDGLVRARVVEGRIPTGPDEIAMTEQAARMGVAVGDTVSLNMLAGEQLGSCFSGGECAGTDVGQVTIVGMLRLADDLAPNPFGSNVYVARESFLEVRGGDDVAFGYIVEMFTADSADLDAIVAEYSARIDGGNLRATADDVAGARRAVAVHHDALIVAAAIVAVAGLLIAGQAFGRFLTRRPSDAATLSSLGMASGERVIAAWLPGVAAAIGGAVLTIPVAVVLSWGLPQGVARRADPDVGFHADWAVLVPGVAATFAIGAVCALWAALLWSRTSVSNTVAEVSVASMLARRLRLSPSAAMGSRFALEPGRGARRTPVIPGLVGTAAAIAVLTGAVAFNSSLDGLLTTPSRYGAPWDLQVSAWIYEEPMELGEQIAADPRVDGVGLAISGELNVSANGSVPIPGFAVGMSSLKGSVDPVILAGRAPAGPNEALLGTDTFERLDLSFGDVIDVGGPLGQQTMVVVGRTIVPVLGSQFPDSGVVVPLQTLLDLGGTETVADIDIQPAVLVTVSDTDDLSAVVRDLLASGATFDGPFQQSAVSVLDELRIIPAFIGGFVVFLGVLASFHALFVTARRRRTDLAVMRALGHGPAQAASVIHWQGCVAAVTSLLIGIPIGLIGGRLLWRSVAEGANVIVVVDTPWRVVVVIALVAVIGTSSVLAAWPAWSARRRRPALDLRSE